MILPNGRMMVGDRLLDLSLRYRKGQKHACDPKCRAAGHIYLHTEKNIKKAVRVMGGRQKEIVVPAREFIRRDGAREHYAIDNPPLLIVNSPKSKGGKNVATYKMKRNSKGQYVAARSNSPRKTQRRKKGHRKNPPFWTAGTLMNSPKHKKKRSAPRRNPPAMQFLGIPLVMPEVADVLGIAGGIAGPPIIKGFAMQMLPASVTTSTLGKWGVELGSYAGPAVIGYMVGGRRVLRMVFAGQLAGIVVRLVQQAAARLTAVLPAVGVAGYIPAAQAGVQARGLNGYVRTGRGMLNGTLNAYADTRQSTRSSRFTDSPRWAGARTR